MDGLTLEEKIIEIQVLVGSFTLLEKIEVGLFKSEIPIYTIP